ncbi:MAG: hypothetical protein AAF138_09560 [Planctomycetota bacterium]
MTATESAEPRIYNDQAEELMASDQFPDRVSLLPAERTKVEAGRRIRILWGQDMLRDVVDGRYRAVVCSVNDADNAHGIIAQITQLVTTSQWSESSVTSYAKIFHESVSVHAAHDREPYVLKYDLDSLLVLALLRPKGRDHFTLDDLSRGFRTVSRMLQGRGERLPVAAVSFLGANSNRLIGKDGAEPSFEQVLASMFEAGYRGDVYPAPGMWRMGHVGVFPSYPFPESLERMRGGSS